MAPRVRWWQKSTSDFCRRALRALRTSAPSLPPNATIGPGGRGRGQPIGGPRGGGCVRAPGLNGIGFAKGIPFARRRLLRLAGPYAGLQRSSRSALDARLRGHDEESGERGNYGDSLLNLQSSRPQWLRESGRGKNRQAIFADARFARFALPHRLYPRTPPSSGRAWTGTANRLSPEAAGAGPVLLHALP